MEQSLYREVNHYRQAYLREDGSIVLVDDVTFNPALHSEIQLEPATVSAPVEPATTGSVVAESIGLEPNTTGTAQS